MFAVIWSKIVLLIAGAVAAHVTWTPPNPTAKYDERKKYGNRGISAIAFHSSHFVPAAYRNGAWVLALCDIISMLSAEFPSPASKQILSFLTFGSASYNHTSITSITPAFVFGSVLQVAGGLLRAACYQHLGRYFTFQLAVAEDHRLVTSGPYSIVRHPSYTAIIAGNVGMLLCWLGRGSWVIESGLLETTLGKMVVYVVVAFTLVTMVGLIPRCMREDRVLRSEFGEAWEAWAKQTPSRLIPGVF